MFLVVYFLYRRHGMAFRAMEMWALCRATASPLEFRAVW